MMKKITTTTTTNQQRRFKDQQLRHRPAAPAFWVALVAHVLVVATAAVLPQPQPDSSAALRVVSPATATANALRSTAFDPSKKIQIIYIKVPLAAGKKFSTPINHNANGNGKRFNNVNNNGNNGPIPRRPQPQRLTPGNAKNVFNALEKSRPFAGPFNRRRPMFPANGDVNFDDNNLADAYNAAKPVGRHANHRYQDDRMATASRLQPVQQPKFNNARPPIPAPLARPPMLPSGMPAFPQQPPQQPPMNDNNNVNVNVNKGKSWWPKKLMSAMFGGIGDLLAPSHTNAEHSLNSVHADDSGSYEKLHRINEQLIAGMARYPAMSWEEIHELEKRGLREIKMLEKKGIEEFNQLVAASNHPLMHHHHHHQHIDNPQAELSGDVAADSGDQMASASSASGFGQKLGNFLMGRYKFSSLNTLLTLLNAVDVK